MQINMYNYKTWRKAVNDFRIPYSVQLKRYYFLVSNVNFEKYRLVFLTAIVVINVYTNDKTKYRKWRYNVYNNVSY